MSDAWHFAIDFGTSNTSAAHTAPMSGAVEAVSLTHRSNLMPSAVYIDDDHVLAGDTALLRGRRMPSQLLLSPKRYIDHDNVQLGGGDVDLLNLVAAVIATALERAKAQHAGSEPDTVTLTHPEAWSVHSVGQLSAAAKRAGIDETKIRTISEPRAAAIHYAAQQQVATGGHVAVFDFGGGTLDIAVLEAEANGNFKVVSAKGDNSLGGRTVDNLLFRWLITQLEQDDPDFADYVRNAPISVMHSLEENIREAKEILSDTSSATISISTPQGERDVLITRDEFNDIINPSVDRAMELTQAALEQAGVSTADTPIYMTGGSSRIPHVQNRLGELGNVMTLDDPKTVVSRGALRATLNGFTEGSSGPVAAPDQPQSQFINHENQFGQQGQANPYAGGAPSNSQAPEASPFGGGQNVNNQHLDDRKNPAEGASTSSAVSFTQDNPKKGGGKTKMALIGLAAVAVVAIGAFTLPNMLGGGGNDDKFAVTPQVNEKHLAKLEPETVDYLPAAFLEKIDRCQEVEPVKSYEFKFAQGIQVRDCSQVSGISDFPQDNNFYKSSKSFVKGDDAKKLQEKFNEMPDTSKVSIQKAKGNNQPELFSAVNDGNTYLVAHYKKQNTMVIGDSYGSMTPGEFEQWAKYYGFLKKK